MTTAVEFLRTVIKNTSGDTKTFSFIPPHGRTLIDDEEVSIPGDLVSQITSKRAREAYEAAVATGEITVRNTPAPIIVDDVTDLPRQIIVTSGAVESEDPILPSL